MKEYGCISNLLIHMIFSMVDLIINLVTKLSANRIYTFRMFNIKEQIHTHKTFTKDHFIA